MSETPPTPAPTPAPAAPASSGSRVLIIIVCIVMGFILLVGGCVATCTYLAAKKVKELGREAQKNPVYASLSLAASLNPDVQVLSKDETSGKITVRNKKTGETVTINANDFTKDTVSQALEKMSQASRSFASAASHATATANEEPAATNSGDAERKNGITEEPKISAGKAAALATMLKGFPDYVPAYPDGTTIEARQNTQGTVLTGSYVFLTSDKLDVAIEFYEKKATAAGFTVIGRSGDTNDFGPTATLNLMRADPQGAINLTAESKEGGKTQVSINLTALSK